MNNNRPPWVAMRNNEDAPDGSDGESNDSEEFEFSGQKDSNFRFSFSGDDASAKLQQKCERQTGTYTKEMIDLFTEA